jgi:hypothetical protein
MPDSGVGNCARHHYMSDTGSRLQAALHRSYLAGLVGSQVERIADDSRVDALLQQLLRLFEERTTDDHDGRCTVASNHILQ